MQIAALLCYSLGQPMVGARYVPDSAGYPVWEQEFDSNGNEIYDSNNADWNDSDGDLLPNWWETYAGTDPLTPDTDGDGLTDRDEAQTSQTNPLVWDTNGDGYSDADNFYGVAGPNGDIDGDGLTNAQEQSSNFDMRDVDSNDDGWTDFEQFHGLHTPESDADSDGLTNAVESSLGTNPHLPDSDNDGFTDSAEVAVGSNPLNANSRPDNGGATVDTDGDGLADYLETQVYHSDPALVDTDGDGLWDGVEVHSYGSSPLSPDSDGDTLPDGYEVGVSTSFRNGAVPAYFTHPAMSDSDWDGLDDDHETNVTRNGGHSSNPNMTDSDADGLPDGFEVNVTLSFPDDWDSDDNGTSDFLQFQQSQASNDLDGDGIIDAYETGIYHTNPALADTDGDGLSDSAELGFPTAVTYPTNPLVRDTDGDKLEDGFELTTSFTNPTSWDTDGDTLSDYDEYHGTDSRDQDGDGLTNDQETAQGTDKLNADTDGDSLWDGFEVRTLTSPLLADTDSDGLDDSLEVLFTHWNTVAKMGAVFTSPLDDDTDDDGLNDGYEVHTSLTQPNSADSDNDGLTDGEELLIYSTNPLNAHTISALYPDWNMVSLTDSDGGGIPDRIETFYGMDTGASNDDVNGDLDGDHIKNIDAYNQGWSLRANYNQLFDGDGDGMTDAWETFFGLNPGDAADRGSDPDHDFICNLEEFRLGTRPNVSDHTEFAQLMHYPLPLGDLTWSPYGSSDWDGDQVPNNDELDDGSDPRLKPDGGGGETEDATEAPTEDATEDQSQYSEFQTEQQTEEQTDQQTQQQTEEETEDQTYDESYTEDQTSEQTNDQTEPLPNYGLVKIPATPKISASKMASDVRAFAESIAAEGDVEEIRKAVVDCLKPEYKNNGSIHQEVVEEVQQACTAILNSVQAKITELRNSLPAKVDKTLAELQEKIDEKSPKISISDNWVPNTDGSGGRWNSLNSSSLSTEGFEGVKTNFKVGFETEIAGTFDAVFVEGSAKMKVKVEVSAEIVVSVSAVNPADPNPLTSEVATVGACPKYTWTLDKKGAVELGVKLESGTGTTNSDILDPVTGTLKRGKYKD